MKEYAYGIVRYNTKTNERIVVKDSCSKDAFKRLAKRARDRFENFSYNSSNDSFVAGNLLFKYEWFPQLYFSMN